MKILFLTHRFHPDVGGIEVNSEILAREFMAAGHDVRVMTWSAATDAKTFDYDVIRQPTLSGVFRQHLWADLVYENNPCLRLSWAALLLRKPTVVALRTWIGGSERHICLRSLIKSRWLNRARAVIAVSDSVRRRCWSKATVIGNPYRSKEFVVLSTSRRTKSFVFVGRLVSDKGGRQAILAVKELLDLMGTNHHKTPSITLTIIGDGPELCALRELVKDCGLQDHVMFTGMLRGMDLVHCLNDHRFLLVPSLWEEPFGNVALEGMACGCVPIVSDGGGLPDAIGAAGLTFPRGNVGGLVACMRRVLEESGLEDALRLAAASHLSNHQPKVVARRYLDVIEAVGPQRE